MEYRRKLSRERDIAAYSRRKPHCDFAAIRDDIRAVQGEIVMLRQLSDRIALCARASKPQLPDEPALVGEPN